MEASTEKKSKTPSPFEGEGERTDEKDGQQNGILQNGLDDASGFRLVKFSCFYGSGW